MKIENTTFGSITIDGHKYKYDVVITMSGDIVKRKKKLSSRKYGTSHKISRKEARFVCEKGCRELIIGTGQYNSVVLSRKAQTLFDEAKCKVVAKATPEALQLFNRSRNKKKIGLFHVTC